MMIKTLLLFLVLCALCGVGILLGSMLGHSAGKAGLFSGAIIGGILGIAAAVWLAVPLNLLASSDYVAAFVGSLIGFGVAAIVAVNNLHGPLIPVASVSLVGLGAILGKALARSRSKQ
jgi:hypothetical protein